MSRVGTPVGRRPGVAHVPRVNWVAFGLVYPSFLAPAPCNSYSRQALFCNAFSRSWERWSFAKCTVCSRRGDYISKFPVVLVHHEAQDHADWTALVRRSANLLFILLLNAPPWSPPAGPRPRLLSRPFVSCTPLRVSHTRLSDSLYTSHPSTPRASCSTSWAQAKANPVNLARKTPMNRSFLAVADGHPLARTRHPKPSLQRLRRRLRPRSRRQLRKQPPVQPLLLRRPRRPQPLHRLPQQLP